MMSGKASPFRARDNNDPEATPPDLLDGGEAPRSFSDIDGKAEPYRSSFGHSPQLRPDFSLDFDDFKEWLKQVSPNMKWEFKHQVYIYKRLRKVFDGDLKRLMVFMPPRHGKSELVTKHFAAYWLKHRPEQNIIIGCYNQQLANRFSRGIRSIHVQDIFLEAESRNEKDPVFDTEAVSETYRMKGQSGSGSCEFLRGTSSSSEGISNVGLANYRANSAAEWETPQGGGVRAVGVGAGITGYGANLIIIDDPIKSRAEANSATYRER